jgi:hypothetical protein
MPKRLDFQQLATTKVKEAKALYRNGHYHGAFYLAGYVLEFSLKAAVCKNLKMDDFFDNPVKLKDGILDKFKTHDYRALIVLAGLYHQLEDDKKVDVRFAINWSHIEKMSWKETCRYEMPNSINYNPIDVKEYISAIDNKKGGFLRWIRKYW